ncbi:MAG: hypothetical protein HQL36_03860 [Alphaproteobacteria bacterium]|nr:hypothetical protein [Alphaproteobacteria bacterium]
MIRHKSISKTIAIGLGAAIGVAAMASSAQALTDEGKLQRGGLLYDWYYKITEGDVPGDTHPAMPEAAGQTGKKTWRCVNCHGYSYTGDVGVKGIMGASGKSPADVIAILKNDTHKYTDAIFNQTDFESLGLFVSKGLIDVAGAKGDVAKGQGYFETICAVCHGKDGKKITDMPPVGAVVNELPDRALHRIRFSKPGVDMPGMSALPADVSIDIWEYTKTLPK